MPDPKNPRQLYEWVCAVYNRTPVPQQSDAWELVLHDYPIDELLTAIHEWQRDTTEEWDQRTRGSKCPEPADLAALVFRKKTFEKSRENVKRFHSCGHCEDGWIRVKEGRTEGGHAIDPVNGAMVRCECWWQFLSAHYRVDRSEITNFLREKREKKSARKQRRAA